jgi:hypothetical protein
MAGSLSEYHCCSKWIRSNRFEEAKGYMANVKGGRTAAPLARFGVVGSIKAISACRGTTSSILERNFSSLSASWPW